MREILEFLQRISEGDKSAVLELSNSLKEKGLLSPIVKGYILSIARNRHPQMIKAFIRYIEPLVIFTEATTGPFKQPDENADGPIRFALTELGRPCGFFPGEGHCLITGQTRSGKTTLLFIIFTQALLKGIKCWLFVKSNEARKFLFLKPPVEIVIVDFKSGIKINPLLRPPGLSKGEWANVFSDIFIQGFTVFEGTQSFIIPPLNELPDNSNLFDLLREIKSTKCFPPTGRKAHWKESAEGRLSGILSGDWAQTFNCAESDLESLAEHNVIFEIGNLTYNQQIFVVNLLTTWLFKYKLKKTEDVGAEQLPKATGSSEILSKNAVRAELPMHFIGLDDANLLFSEEIKKGFYPMSIINDLLATVRKANIYIFCCSHFPNELGSSIKSNAFMQIMFALSYGKDIECMQQSMGIFDIEQKKRCHELADREMIVKLSRRYPKPFLARVPEFHLPEGEISDREAYENNEKVLAPFRAVAKAKAQAAKPTAKVKEEIGIKDKVEISSEEKAFLWDIHNRSYISITERYKTINL